MKSNVERIVVQFFHEFVKIIVLFVWPGKDKEVLRMLQKEFTQLCSKIISFQQISIVKYTEDNTAKWPLVIQVRQITHCLSPNLMDAVDIFDCIFRIYSMLYHNTYLHILVIWPVKSTFLLLTMSVLWATHGFGPGCHQTSRQDGSEIAQCNAPPW